MSIAPVGRLKKSEIVWLANRRCKHYHTYLEHYNCYLDEVKSKERIGYLDIEASNLKANFGIMYCYCIKVGGSDEIIERVVSAEELKTCLDKEVVEQCLKDIDSFDRIYTYYGTKFDIPFIKTRALYHNLNCDAVQYGGRFHRDVYYIARRNIATHSRRLEVVAETILGENLKTKIDFGHWIKAMSGNRESLDYILDHCKKDVIILERVHKKLDPFYMERDTSI